MRDDPVIVTGAAGFIGHAVTRRLLDRGERVLGIDICNDYYDPRLKEARLATILARPGFTFVRLDIGEAAQMRDLIVGSGSRRIVHLAAQAGVRYSLEQPFAYERSNLAGHLAVLEACRAVEGLEHLVYASSSSVYGDRPLGVGGFREDEPCSEPASLYAATKRSCELMSASYASLYGMPQSGLRFFTVYGPWGRPDMAYFSFAEKIVSGLPLRVFGEGRMARDFTYIDDIVAGVVGVLDRPPSGGENRIFNIGGSRPAPLMAMIHELECALGRSAQIVMCPMQPGDVTSTHANTSKLRALTGFEPQVELRDGLARFVAWYEDYRNLRAAA